MTREREPLAVAIAILIAAGALVWFAFVVVSTRLTLIQNEIATDDQSPVDVSGWQTYQNDQYGFEIEYPPQWTISTDGLTNGTPFIVLGDPLDGPKTYSLQIFIENNTSSLSSGEYAHAVIAAAKAQDAANAKNAPGGAAPQTAPQFDKSYVLNVGSYPAYELYNVFEFDHDAERIYIAHGNETLHFDFPVAAENPNLSLPVANNNTAHEILSTLVFTK